MKTLSQKTMVCMGVPSMHRALIYSPAPHPQNDKYNYIGTWTVNITSLFYIATH